VTTATKPDTNINNLRLTVALNHLKRNLLSISHQPKIAQWSLIADKLKGLPEETEITGRTWRGWFAQLNTIPKQGKTETLDRLGQSVSLNRHQRKSPPAPIYTEFIHGGLVSRMMATPIPKQPLIAMLERAESYKPLSPLHLHLDAIQIDALDEGFGGIAWEVVKKIGSERILTLLHKQWNPISGSRYSTLSSNLKVELDSCSPLERAAIRKVYSRMKPDRFDIVLANPAQPSWSKTGIDSDIQPLHIYKLLFALGAETQFLVGDRLAAWSLDLATAALALHAYAWTDRFSNYGVPPSDAVIYGAALDDIFFSLEELNVYNGCFMSALSASPSNMIDIEYNKFLEARILYQTELIQLGLTFADVYAVSKIATKSHPLIHAA